MFALVILSFVRFVQEVEIKNNVLPKHEIVTNNTSQFVELWKKSDIILTWERTASDLVAVNDRAFLIVLTEDISTPSQYSTLRSLDLETGQIEWEVRDKINDNVAYNSKYIFAGVGRKKVVAYDTITGVVVWETPLQSRSIAHMVATEYELHVEASPAQSYVIDTITGAVKNTTSSSEGSPVYFVDDNIAYWQPLPLYLRATNAKTKNTIWEVQFADPFVATPLFSGDHIFVRTRLGRLYVLDRSSGAILWKIDDLHADFLASNITVSSNVVYFLTKDAHLQVRDVQTGHTLGTLIFEPSLFDLSDGDYANNTFNVAASSNIVLVYFGDSQQLFAFRFLPDE